ncbi:hypothetical protein [Uliginosibacterium sp. TH139]|uniref:hypothetical protein n=1 Tax=Uliginosibacterium sp. TH139 TaxID=2067453 RepID=UPI000C7AB0FE|nr:hypothetical protein [Uliginosibacterium sp. TH139]PLK49342.1 hypothetical protein C0V76_09105 [Uliginosibacterium sp. TH139]
MHRSIKPAAGALLLSLILVACGGGGGDDSGSSTTTAAASSAAASSKAASSTAAATSSTAAATSSTATATSSTAASVAAGVPINAYSATNAPDNSAAITLSNATAASFTVSGANFANNGAGEETVDTSAAAATNWAKYTGAFDASSTYPKSVTFVARVKGAAATYKGMDLEIAVPDTAAGAASRVKLIVSTNTTTGPQIEKYDNTNSIKDNTVDVSSYHIYHIVLTLTSASTGTFTTYVDGAENANLSVATAGALRPASTTTDNYVAFGANSTSNKYQGSLDWMVWMNGAYTPAQLSGQLPSSLGTTTGY